MKNSKIISFRRDLFTYKKYEKKELFKFYFKDNMFFFDRDQVIKSRGVYFKKDNYSKNNLFKVRQKICKAYKLNLSNESFNNLTDLIKGTLNIKDE